MLLASSEVHSRARDTKALLFFVVIGKKVTCSDEHHLV